MTADIEKAFLMVSVQESDCDVLRFLWVQEVSEDPPKIRPLRFTRVVLGVCSSSFLLNATIKHHLEQYKETHPDLIQLLIDSFYVHVLTAGAKSEEAHSVFVDAKQILKEGGFNLHKFHSNSSSLQEMMDVTGSPGGAHSPVGESYAEFTLGTMQPVGP